MFNDKVVVLTREVVDEILSELAEHTERWDLTGKIREQMERKDIPTFNSPTISGEPLTILMFIGRMRYYRACYRWSAETFRNRAEDDLDESGPWVKEFWDTGNYGSNEFNPILPPFSGTYWDEDSKTAIVYLKLRQHEIVFDPDTFVIKVRFNCSAMETVLPWEEWVNDKQWLGSTLQELDECMEKFYLK